MQIGKEAWTDLALQFTESLSLKNYCKLYARKKFQHYSVICRPAMSLHSRSAICAHGSTFNDQNLLYAAVPGLLFTKNWVLQVIFLILRRFLSFTSSIMSTNNQPSITYLLLPYLHSYSSTFIVNSIATHPKSLLIERIRYLFSDATLNRLYLTFVLSNFSQNTWKTNNFIVPRHISAFELNWIFNSSTYTRPKSILIKGSQMYLSSDTT